MRCSKRWPMRAAGSCSTGCAPTTARRLNELCARLAMTRQAVSKHLGILEEANLVATVQARPREAALPQSGADPRDRRALDREIRTPSPAGAERHEKGTGNRVRREQMSKPVFVYVTYIASTPDKVFKALTDTDATGEVLVRQCRYIELEGRRADRISPRGQADPAGQDPGKRSAAAAFLHVPADARREFQRRTALARCLRARAAARSGQAHGHARRFRAKTARCSPASATAGRWCCRTSRATSRPERRRSTRLGTTRRKRRPRPEREPAAPAGRRSCPASRACWRPASRCPSRWNRQKRCWRRSNRSRPSKSAEFWRFRTRQGRPPLGFCQRLGPIPAYRGRTGW